ncbi:MAG TPA: UDP-N-acetylglucosamine 2-epimerase (non-hydrolyzing) [Solirubrobacteraceae bacterium]|jgi:UDP-N-acetylglucosamine 2-epimerase (non-hydrolysing)/UDP-GlcNAc3NAcA epimerase|nr:UDP-N-acetylglucosamine 2-epimerase (non-hydrolyzing) [Solirubrobacteraceae bacterium]
MRIATVVGNRPQFVKAAAVSPRLRERHEELLIHTGQHHDAELSAVFFDELGVPEPDHSLAVFGGSNSSQLARMLEQLEALLRSIDPDVVLVYGDTNSTLAGALAASGDGIALVHVEAGMRSFDRTQPEERNRVLSDQLAALLLCSNAEAAENLEREATPGRAVVVGDVMVDVAMAMRERVLERSAILERFELTSGGYVLATAHRASNVDDAGALEALVTLLEAVAGPIILPLHPRTRERLKRYGLLERAASAATLTAPLGYLDFAALLHNARAVLTDSGGVQKEAYLAAVPCVTLRDQTEWTDTVAAGWNTLAGLDAGRAVAALAATPPAERPPLWGEAGAAARVVAAIEDYAAA